MCAFAGGPGSYGVESRKGSATVGYKPHKRQNGVQLAMQILRKEGFRGLYRGFGASIATFVPSSAIWCASWRFTTPHPSFFSLKVTNCREGREMESTP